jgi:hypothetical protein
MKKVLATLLIVGLLGVTAFAMPYIALQSTGETLATQTPSFTVTVGFETPLGVAYTKLDVSWYTTVTVGNPVVWETWGARFCFTYGNSQRYLQTGFTWDYKASFIPFLAFRYTFDLPWIGE